DEKDVARLEVGEQRREVARPLEHRPGGLPQVDPELAGDDVRERRLAKPRRPEEQHMVESLGSCARRGDENLELAARFLLADILGKRRRPERALDLFFWRRRPGGD